MTYRDDREAYLSHLHAEHSQLEQTANQIMKRFSESRQSTWGKVDRVDLGAMLCALERELSRHIEEENQGGCVDEALLRCPSLLFEARRIFQESDKLKTELEAVKQVFETAPLPEVRNAFREFTRSLKLHDQHEEMLVEKGLNKYPYA